ncbi:hypothetical protein PHSY_003188 [Pseudozyma hubeiensis SY62]|uniref:CENP-C homolog n=1 Tax=Pseudozyma hubeiensis (strain SY62) TaxID=1305764 RepID=R9P2Y1_PSEHS|nr:hypothetical protein PHSY_003188 [Pseudozyma hubeiensis SY62]GAC95612.1 hypothetical protein PHSY_003188 [Pseudozyma hubeiensis SY62]
MTSQASRRFHEAGVGSRTGLRLSAVARDQDGFEDLEAFYKASQAALDIQKQQQPDDDGAEDEDDYDSFDETRFSRRPAHGGANGRNRQVASSSSMMDIQNSSAPSPRSMLRSIRDSTAAGSSSSPSRGGRVRGNITLADDDDDLDLPNLSTGSRSFDLVAMGGEDEDEHDRVLRAPPTPKRGLSARKGGATSSPKAKGKGKEPVNARRVELSDSEDDRILASIQQRLESAYDDEDDQAAMSEEEIVPVKPSPIRANPTASAVQPRSPNRPTKSHGKAAASPKRKPGRPPKSRAVEPEPDPEPAFGLYYDEPESAFYPEQSLSPPPPPAAAQPPKRKRGRPPKNPQPEERDASHRPLQKSKGASNGVGRPAKAAKSKRAAGEVVEKVRSQPREATVFDENGVRRSTRQRFAPLEYWRGERIRYGRPSLPIGTTPDDLRGSQRRGEDEFEEDPSMMHMRKRVPVLDIKEVIRVPRAPGEGTFSGTTRSRNAARRKVDRKSEERTPRLTSQTPVSEDEWSHLDPTADTIHVEDGWDDRTVETGKVIDDEEEAEVEMSVVRTKATHRPVTVANQEFRFEKFFNCGGLMATGVLHLPPGARKPTKPSKDNSFVFCVLQGALRATVHRKSFIVGPEGIFQVPAGNTYSLENICQRDVHLFFAQCRKTKKANAGDLTTFTQMSDTSYGTPQLHRPKDDQRAEGRLGSVLGRTTEQMVPHRSMLAQDSDAEDSEEDDFETSRQIKSKKRVFRKV